MNRTLWKVRTPGGQTLATYATKRMALAAAKRIRTKHPYLVLVRSDGRVRLTVERDAPLTPERAARFIWEPGELVLVKPPKGVKR